MTKLLNSGENLGVMADKIIGDINFNQTTRKLLPALLPTVIEKISELCIDNDETLSYDIPVPFRYEDKIRYNDIKSYKEILNEYGVYYGICDTVLNSLDDIQPNRKNRLLKAIHFDYLQIKSQLLEGESSNIDLIRKYSDIIIDRMVKRMKNKIESSYNGENIFSDDLECAITIFLCYCFGECKILEKPE